MKIPFTAEMQAQLAALRWPGESPEAMASRTRKAISGRRLAQLLERKNVQEVGKEKFDLVIARLSSQRQGRSDTDSYGSAQNDDAAAKNPAAPGVVSHPDSAFKNDAGHLTGGTPNMIHTRHPATAMILVGLLDSVVPKRHHSRFAIEVAKLAEGFLKKSQARRAVHGPT